MALKHFLKRKKISVMIFCYVLLSSYVCVHFAFCASDPCTLKVFEEQSGDRIEDLCLEEYKDPDCLPFVEHFNRLELPTGFSLTDDDDPVQRPESLDVTFSFEQDKDNGKEALVLRYYVDWSSPLDRFSRENTKGYLLIWDNTYNVICRLFKFDASKTDLLGKKLRFQYKIQDLESLLSYAVKVYSMPPPKNLEESQKKSTFKTLNITAGSSILDDDSSGNWNPSLSTRFLKEDAIGITFAHYPPSYNVTQFEVRLIKRSVSEDGAFIKRLYTQPPDSQGSQGSLSFTKLEDDEYLIKVEGIDPFPTQVDKCSCWYEERKNIKKCLGRCNTVSSDWIKVSIDDPGKWIPPLSTSVLKEGAIEVKIGHSPSRFNLTQFKVILKKKTSFENSAFKTIFYTEPSDSLKPAGLVSFTNLVTDEYKIVIQVIDPFLKQTGKCLCWVKGANGRHCRNSCGSVATDWIEVPANVPGKWIPTWNTRMLKEGAIEVKIGHSPSRFNLTQFKVMLMKGTSFEKSAFKTIFYTEPSDSLKPAGLVSFTNLDNDEYKIVIQVIDPFLKQIGKCLCWVKGTNGRHCRNSCGRVATDWMEMSVDVPGKWIPPLNTRVLKEGAIEVKIGHSPSRFNLTQFAVILKKRAFSENNAFQTISYTEPPDSRKPAGSVSFTNLENGEYKIVVEVIDPFLKQVGKCLCWIKGTNGRRCKNKCGVVVSDWINVSVHVPEELKAERSRNSSPSELNKGTMITTLLTVIFLVGST